MPFGVPTHTVITRRLAKLREQPSDAISQARIDELEHVLRLLEADGLAEDHEPTVPRGAQPYRLRDNPAERRLAKAWIGLHAGEYMSTACDHLGLLLDTKTGGQRPVRVTKRDRIVAATVIQWLGSPCGLPWLGWALGPKRLREMAKHAEEEARMSKAAKHFKT